MRWGGIDPKNGEVRIIKRFLLFPRCIHGECRWLEVASIVQEFDNNNWADDGWKDRGWLKEYDKLK